MTTHAVARCVHQVAALGLIWAPAGVVWAQQYGPGVVLDPVQPGNIAEIRRREREYFSSLSVPSYQPQPEVQPPSWDQRAKRAFQSGNYAQAANGWRHGLVDEPKNGIQALLLAQAEFAAGNVDEAVGAVQLGMLLLPHQQWGLVVKNYKALYLGNQPFTDQLRALERACKATPHDPAGHFLLGYEYLYLGYPKQAETELKKALQLEPQDQFCQRLIAVATGTPVLPIQPLSLRNVPPTFSSGGRAAEPQTLPSPGPQPDDRPAAESDQPKSDQP